MQFPTVSGDDLLRRRITVPSGLEGRLNLLLIAFQRWHQDLIDGWLPAVAQLESRHPGLRHYELPVLPNMGWLSRTFVNEGMRAGIPDQQTRAATITLYIDKSTFMEALELPGDHTIYVLLLDSDGNVLWREAGAFEAGKGQAMAEAVAAAMGAHALALQGGQG